MRDWYYQGYRWRGRIDDMGTGVLTVEATGMGTDTE